MKNKTFKYASFKELTNTFDPERRPPEWPQFFGNARPLTLELGCGKAEWLLEMARLHPERNFVGIDIKSDRLWRPAEAALTEDLKNTAFLRTHLLNLGEFFAPHSADQMWITFPDPYPKKRQVKHRMLTPQFLAIYREILLPGGTMHLKTDNRPFFDWAMETLVAQGMHLRALTFDLHESSQPDEAKIMTTYERKFVAEGLTINYVAWQFPEV